MKRRVPFPAVAAAAYAALAVEAAWKTTPAGFTLCPFKLLTGLDCPGCGMGHAIVYGMRGDFDASFRAHPLGLPVLLIWTVWLAWGTFNVACGVDFSDGMAPASRRPAVAWSALALVLGVYAARLMGLAPV